MNESLTAFCDWFNDAPLERVRDVKLNHFRYIHAVARSFEDHFITQQERKYIGVSSIYHPVIQLGMKQLGFPFVDNVGLTVKNGFIFHFGDVFEAIILELMRGFGITVEYEQQEVYYKGIRGHIDCVAASTLIDVKTMNQDYFKRFYKEPNDSRGYLTQLALYKDCIGSETGGWLIFNKGSNKIHYIEADNDVLDAHRQLADNKIFLLNQITDVESLVKNCTVPSPRAEIYKGEETGKYLPPLSLNKNSPYLHCFFEVEESKNKYGKLTTYVSQYPRPQQEIIENLQEKLDNAS